MENQQQPQFDKTKLFLPVSILFAALLISGAIFYTKGYNTANIGSGAPKSGETIKVSTDDDAFMGAKNAKVVLVEFSDFQCPFCRRFWKETLPSIKKDFIDTGKIKFVYRDFPLNFHPAALPSAQGSECAREQGKYWQFHDKIFQEQDSKGEGTITFTITDLKQWAAKIGLNAGEFNSCLDSGKYTDEVQKDYNDGVKYGVSGTPTVFVNGKSIVGAQPYEVFKAAIEEALK